MKLLYVKHDDVKGVGFKIGDLKPLLGIVTDDIPVIIEIDGVIKPITSLSVIKDHNGFLFLQLETEDE